MIAMYKLFYNTIAACQRPVGPLLSNKCMYVIHCRLRSNVADETNAAVVNVLTSAMSSGAVRSSSSLETALSRHLKTVKYADILTSTYTKELTTARGNLMSPGAASV